MSYTEIVNPKSMQYYVFQVLLNHEQRKLVNEAIKEKKVVEMKYSSLKDNGKDWCKVLIDGKEVANIKGY